MIRLFAKFFFMAALLCGVGQALAETLTFSVHGVPDDIETNVQNLLLLDLKKRMPLTTEKIDQAYEQAPKIIRQGVEPFGFFHATIIPRRLRKVSATEWKASYSVNLGPVVKVSRLNVQVIGAGHTLSAFKTMLNKISLKLGQQFNMKLYDDTKEQLLNTAAEQGFLSATLVKHQVVIDRVKNTCSIDLVLDTRSQYYFGSVDFKGSTYKNSFLGRYVTFHPGERYTSDALLKLQENLTNSVYFDAVSVHPDDPEDQSRDVPIVIELKERKSRHYTFGAGYGTDTGFRGIAGFDWYHITNNGHYFKSYAQLSQLQSMAQARYIMPGKNPVTDQYFWGLNLEQQDINRNKGDTQKLSFGRVDKYHEWQRTFSLGYQFDHYSLNDSPFEQTRNLIPTMTFQRTHADNIIFPRHGYSISFSTLGSLKALASSSTFLQGTMDMQWVFSPFKPSRILMRGNLGVTATEDINMVPLSLQLFAGGAQSVRGYDYQELGPGKYLMVGSVEYQHKIKGQWWAAMFFDAGNAINSFSDPKGNFIGDRPPSSINLSHWLKTSAGIGVVYVSPVGAIEVTLAKPLNDSNKSVKLQVVMGANL